MTAADGKDNGGNGLDDIVKDKKIEQYRKFIEGLAAGAAVAQSGGKASPLIFGIMPIEMFAAYQEIGFSGYEKKFREVKGQLGGYGLEKNFVEAWDLMGSLIKKESPPTKIRILYALGKMVDDISVRYNEDKEKQKSEIEIALVQLRDYVTRHPQKFMEDLKVMQQ